MTNEELDACVLHAVAGFGKSGLTASRSLIEFHTSADDCLNIGYSLQRLRRKRRVTFSSATGWTVVEESL